jgi:putative membrane protein
MASMPILAHVAGSGVEPLQIIVLTVIGTAYALRATTLARERRSVARWRVACFYAGLAVIAVVLVGPLGHIGEELVFMHMIQHLLLADVAALLIVLGLTRALLQPLLSISPISRLQVLTLPFVALPLWIATLYVWHLPALYDGVVTSEALHTLMHASFLGFGFLMWMPLFGPLPVPAWFGGGAQLAYTAIARLAAAALGNVLMWSGTVLYTAYSPAEWGISALADQSIAGAIMMAEGMLVTLAMLAWLLLRWAARDTEKQRLLDLAYEHGVALDERRAERAVATGQGGRLEERLRQS